MSDPHSPTITLGANTVLAARCSPEVESVEIDGETVLYDCVRNAIHLLNPVATLLWEFLDGSSTLGEVSADLAAVFDRSESDVLAEVVDFARGLVASNLVMTR